LSFARASTCVATTRCDPMHALRCSGHL
jgi:hypothetical protein